MAKIDHIESISDKLAETTMAVLPKRCSYIRNWHSKCKACLNACPHEALERAIGQLYIDSAECTNCGTCAVACPASAMVTGAPDAGEIVKEARLSAQANEGHAVFACSTLFESEKLDTDKVVALPCLDYLDEYLLTGLFALGIKSVNLLHAPCGECPVGGPSPSIEQTVANVRDVMELWGIDAKIRFTDRIPSQVRPSRSSNRGSVSGESRRGAFRQAGGSVLGYVAQAVNDAVDGIMAQPEKPKPKKQITVRLDEVFPADTYRSVRMLNMLDTLGKRPRGQMIDTRFWADVKHDPSKCRYCGGCAKMCATRALKFSESDNGTRTLTFTPSLCVNCRLCKDTCLTHSMVYSTKVLADDLDRDVVHVLYTHEKEKGNPFSFFDN